MFPDGVWPLHVCAHNKTDGKVQIKSFTQRVKGLAGEYEHALSFHHQENQA